MLRSVYTARKTFGAFAAVLLLGTAALAVEAAPAAATGIKSQINEIIDSLDQGFADIREGLRIQYDELLRDRDDSGAALFKKVRALNAEREKESAAMRAEMRKFTKSMEDQKIPPTDQRYRQGTQKFVDEENAITDRFDSSLSLLQRAYQLDNKRYNELLKIHSAREALENERNGRQRDIAAESVRLEQSGLGRRQLSVRRAALSDRQRELESDYKSQLDALDGYAALVNKRLKAQQSFLADYDKLIAEMNAPGSPPAAGDKILKNLTAFSEKKAAEERAYQNDLLAVDERMTMERARARELGRFADERRTLEMARVDAASESADKRSSLLEQSKSASLSADAKKAFESRIAALDSATKADAEAYDQALKSLGERRSLMEKALDDRQSYLKDRNALRSKLAEKPNDAAALESFRKDIGALEDKRMAQERDLRGKLSALRDQIPSRVHAALFSSVDFEGRADRLMNRIDAMRGNLQTRRDRQDKNLRDQIASVDNTLLDNTLAEEARTHLSEQRALLQSEAAAAKLRFDRAIAALEQRKTAEQRRVADRKAFVERRRDLMTQLDKQEPGSVSLDRLNAEIANLDNDFASKEREFSGTLRMPPMAGLFSSDDSSVDGIVSDADIQASWDSGVKKTLGATAEAGRKIAFRTAREGESAWESFKDKVSETYHDAVDYLTD